MPLPLLVLAAFAAALAPPAGHARFAAAIPQSLSKLLGQRIMIALPGTTTASPSVLRQVRAGQVGGVVLYARNISSDAQVRALTATLQNAARAAGNPPLLIATDQEGGEVKRFPNAPLVPPPQITASGSTKFAFNQGWLTGRYLRARGVNMDLAPVVDVPTSPSSFIWREGRAFSFNASDVGRYATSFMVGIQAAGVAATAKHFPGVGSASVDTDLRQQELHPSDAERKAALRPYQSLIAHGLDVVLVAPAGFPAYDPTGTAAALSGPIISGLLRGRLGFTGVVSTEALNTPTGHTEAAGAVLAARAGADILLFADSGPGALGALESALARGRITRAQAVASYQRIVALKQRLPG